MVESCRLLGRKLFVIEQCFIRTVFVYDKETAVSHFYRRIDF